jgi:outer membrane protein OmpA-like peptidoglycan-associated protein
MIQIERTPSPRVTRFAPCAGGALALAAALVLAACASRGPLPEIEAARTQINSATANPDVARRAPLELKTATDTLARADRVWSEDGDQTEAKHLAYLAQKQAETATALTHARAADDQMKDARSQADRLRLQARTSEAEAARGQAMAAQAQADQANARAAGLEARLKELEAQQTERGLLVTLGDVLFEFGKAQLLPTAGPRLDKLADFLKQYPDRRLLIEGHTDSVGSNAANLTLSERRAQSVQQALTQRGVDPGRITTRGYGKSFPVASNGTPEGRALNRRVEVVIADDKGVLRSRN